MEEIYLDNSLVAKPSEALLSAVYPYLSDSPGTPAAPHQEGQKLVPALQKSFASVEKLFGGEGTFIPTVSGGDAVRQLLFANFVEMTSTTGRNQYLTSNSDEAAIIMAHGDLEKMGSVCKMLPVNAKGVLTPDVLADHVSPRTAMVSLSWVNGLTGVIQPVAALSEVCKERGIIFHIDATHALGKLVFNFEDLGADVVTFDGAPLHAPLGTGGIYFRKGFHLNVYPHPAPSAMIALGQMAEELIDSRDLIAVEGGRLRGLFESRLTGKPLMESFERVSSISVIDFSGVSAEAMLWRLNRKQVYANMGGGSMQQLNILLSTYDIKTHSALSFSLARTTQEAEIDEATRRIEEAYLFLRGIA